MKSFRVALLAAACAAAFLAYCLFHGHTLPNLLGQFSTLGR